MEDNLLDACKRAQILKDKSREEYLKAGYKYAATLVRLGQEILKTEEYTAEVDSKKQEREEKIKEMDEIEQQIELETRNIEMLQTKRVHESELQNEKIKCPRIEGDDGPSGSK